MSKKQYTGIIGEEQRARENAHKNMAAFATGFVVANTVTRCIINSMNRKAKANISEAERVKAREIYASDVKRL